MIIVGYQETLRELSDHLFEFAIDVLAINGSQNPTAREASVRAVRLADAINAIVVPEDYKAFERDNIDPTEDDSAEKPSMASVLREFMCDIEAAGLDEVREDWPDLLITYEMAKHVLKSSEGTNGNDS